MEKENKTVSEDKLTLEEESALLKELKKLQENSVPKDQYEKDLKAEKEKADMYLQAIVQGNTVDAPETDSKSLEEMIKESNDFKGTNLEFWTKQTKLIDKVLKEVPDNEISTIAGDDGIENIVKVNSVMKDLVKKADGDPDYFISLYNNRVRESSPTIASDINKAGSLINYLSQPNK